MHRSKVVSSHWYRGPTEKVAKQLLGKVLCRRVTPDLVLRGIIVEVEAYLHVGDAASHSARGKTPSNAAMFQEPGRLYVYPIHAKYCMNVVTQPEGQGAAVLIRSVEPIAGIQYLLEGRGQPEYPTNNAQWRKITTGPGRLCQAFQINRTQDGIALSRRSGIWIEHLPQAQFSFRSKTSTRIGITRSEHLELRFFIDGNLFVSGLARDHSEPRNARLDTTALR